MTLSNLSLNHVYKEPLQGLYLISTPIGNSYDISLRALATLSQVDHLYVEDTRVTQNLLDMYGIHRKLLSYHDHNGAEQRPHILKALQAGQSVGLASDAGTPLVHDPGFKLVDMCIEHQIPFTAVPGPSSVINGLLLSGLSPHQFQFCGFVPATQSDRQVFYAQHLRMPHTLIFFETGARLQDSLQDLHHILGNRTIAIAREMTKMFETITRGCVADLMAQPQEQRGEFVLVVQGYTHNMASEDEAEQLLRTLLQTKPLKIAARVVADCFDLSRHDVYEMGLKIKDE